MQQVAIFFLKCYQFARNNCAIGQEKSHPMNNTSWWKNKCHQTWNSIRCAPIVHHGESDVFPFWRISTILDTWTFPLYFIQLGDCWTSPTIFLRAYSSKISQTKENVMNDHGLVTCHHFKCETPPNTCLWISFFLFRVDLLECIPRRHSFGWNEKMVLHSN